MMGKKSAKISKKSKLFPCQVALRDSMFFCKRHGFRWDCEVADINFVGASPDTDVRDMCKKYCPYLKGKQ
jgi:hypothetical protein